MNGGRATACFLAVVLSLLSSHPSNAGTGVDQSALVEAGRRIYREGRRASGEAISGMVQGDVKLDGAQVTCESCHRRSGMGTGEGGRLTPPVAGSLLFIPGPHRRRPAYDGKTLARAIREGVDSAGRVLDPLMPRYALEDADVEAIAAYLRSLGSTPSPGADAGFLRFAVVIAADAPPADRQAMMDILTAFFTEKNAQVRRERARTQSRRAPGEQVDPYREWGLEIWDLTGPPGGWRAQMESLSKDRPVFALLSGLVPGSWQPIHDFCQAREVPCLLPNSDLPPGQGSDYYGLYVSGGLRLEAEVLAAEIAASGRAADVVQIVSAADPKAAEAAATFESALSRRGGRSRMAPIDPRLETDEALRAIMTGPASAVVLWLGPDIVKRLPPGDAAGGAGDTPGSPIYFSSMLLGGGWDVVPAALRSQSRVVHLHRLPGEKDPARDRFRFWADARGIEIRSERLQAQTWFACMAMVDGSKHLGRYPYRDYLLDLLDHSASLSSFLPFHPRGELGPGQRYFAKGGYVISLAGGDPSWIVP